MLCIFSFYSSLVVHCSLFWIAAAAAIPASLSAAIASLIAAAIRSTNLASQMAVEKVGDSLESPTD